MTRQTSPLPVRGTRVSSRRRLLCAAVAWPLAGWSAPVASKPTACGPLLSHTFLRLQDEKPVSLCDFTGQVLLVVNTASLCGFTGQYSGLEALDRRWRERGLVVIGFPSNDFGRQEPGNARQIADFCENTFGVKFPMFAASSVRGEQANPFFRHLIAQGATPPRWNFYKYLIGRDGKLIDSYSSMTEPDSRSLIGAIEKSLKANP